MRALLSAVAALLVMAAPASAASTSLVINEVDYDQPGTDAAEFLEIKNVSASAINLDPYQLRFVNGANGLDYLIVNLPNFQLAGGDYYVVCANTATTPNCDLDIAPDTNLIQNGSPDGVVLENATGVVDGLGYAGGAAMAGVTEGANATTEVANNVGEGLARVPDGCDTDDNSTDFQRAAITPGASNGGVACGGPPADSAPSVASSNPASGVIDVPPGAPMSVTFSEPVNVDANAFALACAGGSHALTVAGGPTTFNLDPAGSFAEGEACTLTVEADAVHDQDGADPPDTMAADAAIPFTTLAQVVRIREIQGTSHLSPLMTEPVSHVPGVVTARRANGFYMQDPSPDADPDTSEGLFVFTSTTPAAAIAVGKSVTVSGRVSEFRPATRPADLTLTEIVQPTVTVGDDGPDIAPALIGSGGRVPPGRIIDNDSLGDVEVSSLFDPDEDGIDFYESMEGMLVRVNSPLVVGPTASFGEIPVVGDEGLFAGPRTARGGVLVEADDFNPERMQLDDEVLRALSTPFPPMPAASVNDRLSTVEAVVDYSFANYKLQVTSQPTVTDGGLEKEITEEPGRHELSVGSFNVENLTPNDSAAKYAALAHTLAVRMQAPDIVAVEEIQDNNGTTGGTTNPVVDASQTWAKLIAAIQAAGGPVYDYRQIDPVAHQDGGAPGGNIRVGFLFRTDRGLDFVDRPGGTSTNANEIVDTPHGARLKYSPGRIQPADPAWIASRKPLAGEFNWRGRTVIAVANHFASKGGDDPLFGHFQPPVRHTEIGEDGRHEQAKRVNEFARDLLAKDNQARLIVLGDINDFDFSETVDILESGGVMTSLYETLPPDERYSYVFEGNSQVLDQILVSPTLMHPSPEYDSVHMNAEFADQTSDHDPQVARLEVTGRRH